MRHEAMLFTVLLPALTLFASATAGEPPRVWSADTIEWQENRPGGKQRTMLEGAADQVGGVVMYAFHMPDGTWFPPHTHPTTARVFILKGTLLLGEGDVEDRSAVRRVTAGRVAIVPAGLAHYEGAEGDTVLIGVATGPLSTSFIGDRPGSSKHP